MSPFVIFVIVLTIIYIIYYAVMITRDLYGKKEDHKTQEEVFDVSDMVEEEAALEFLSTPHCKIRNSSYEFAVLSKNKILRDF